jgi:hypothetical protein
VAVLGERLLVANSECRGVVLEANVARDQVLFALAWVVEAPPSALDAGWCYTVAHRCYGRGVVIFGTNGPVLGLAPFIEDQAVEFGRQELPL